MSISATSPAVSLITAAVSSSSSSSSSASASTSSSSTTAKLVKLANGEYTAASVSSDQTDANKLGLRKEKDGNYGTAAPSAVTTSGSAAAQSSAAVQDVLSSLSLGGS